MKWKLALTLLAALTVASVVLYLWPASDRPLSPPGLHSDVENVSDEAPRGREVSAPAEEISRAIPAPDVRNATGTLVFVLHDSAMNELAGEEIRIRGTWEDASQFAARTDDDGTATFGGIIPGVYSYAVVTSREGQLEGSSMVRLAPGESKVVRLQVPDYSESIGGWVLDPQERPVQGLIVEATRIRPVATTPSLYRSGESALTDTDGSFSIRGLQVGEYELRIDSDRFVSTTTIARAPGDGLVLHVVQNLAQRIEGRVTTPEGEPLARVSVIPPAGSAEAVETDQRGYYSVLATEIRSGERFLRFQLPGYLERRVSLGEIRRSNTGAQVLDVRLEPIGATVTLTGHITDEFGQPLARQVVHIHSPTLYTEYRAASSEDGAFRLESVAAGDDYRLWVRPDREYQDFTLNRVALLSDTSMDITLESLGTGFVSGRVVDAEYNGVPSFQFWIRSARSKGRAIEVTTDEYGSFEVDDVPAGTLTLGARSRPGPLMSNIELEAGETRYLEITLHE